MLTNRKSISHVRSLLSSLSLTIAQLLRSILRWGLQYSCCDKSVSQCDQLWPHLNRMHGVRGKPYPLYEFCSRPIFCSTIYTCKASGFWAPKNNANSTIVEMDTRAISGDESTMLAADGHCPFIDARIHHCRPYLRFSWSAVMYWSCCRISLQCTFCDSVNLAS